jgi:diaminohydroxyphosphoribosylaminopyrimidine deaminase/5-amino-6-(5-phosphoribosylamino)uracil reductase
VAGAGFARLGALGLEVSTGLLETEARRMNEAYLHSRARGRPFGILKVAMTLDGKIATASGESRWITSEASRQRVHDLRHSVDALLTGSGTVLSDDPALTDRSGKARRRPLLKAVIDRRGRLTPGLKVLSNPPVLVYTQLPRLALPPPVDVVTGVTDLPDVVGDLSTRKQVQSFMLECGPDLAFDAVRRGIVDKMVIFVAPRIFGGREVPAFGSVGVSGLDDAIGIGSWECESVGRDLMITAYVHGTD